MHNVSGFLLYYQLQLCGLHIFVLWNDISLDTQYFNSFPLHTVALQ